MSKNYVSYPAEEVSSGLRTVFLYAAPEDAEKLPALAERIAHPHHGTKCRVKWLNPAMPIDEADVKNELSLAQVLIVYVTKSLLAHMRELKAENRLPLPIQFMRENQRPYFPLADFAENLEAYCKLDRPIHGLMESDPDFDNKLKEQLSKYVLDEETLSEIREKGIINQIFMSYRKDDVIAAQELMRAIHNFKGFDAISIWYDRFLAAGNLFDKEILDALDQSSAFTMVISPKITAKREDGSDNYVVEHEYPRAHEKKKPIVPIHVPDYKCNHDDLKSVFKDIPQLLAIEQTEPYLRSIFPDLPAVDTYNSERLYLLGRAYLSGFYFEQNTKKGVSLLQKAAEHEDEHALKSARMLAELYNSGDLVGDINYDEDLKWRLRTSEITEIMYGKERYITAASYSNIGAVYNIKGDYEKALEYYFKALEIYKKVLGKDHHNTAILYNNIGSIYGTKGDYETALLYHFRALEMHKEALGKDPTNTATSYNNIGMVYKNKGNYEKALKYYLKALEMRERVLGKVHPDTAGSYNNIGSVYDEKGDYEKALEYHFKALEIVEKVLEKEHPDMATSYNNIGIVYRNKGEYEKALEYFFKALEINEKILGKEHLNTAMSYNNIGESISISGLYEKALEYHFKALEAVEKVLGKEHPDTAILYNNIGSSYLQKRDYNKALMYYFKALDINERVLSKEHLDTAKNYNNIAAIYCYIYDFNNALEYFKKAISIYIHIFGKEHPTVKTFTKNALIAFRLSGRNESEFENWLNQP
jgi:tetratricopeptide (TPR) repeat protein